MQQHRFHAHLWCRLAQVGEDIARAAHGQGITDHLPAPEGVQRPVPNLVKHPQRLLTPILLAQLPQPLAQGLRIVPTLLVTANAPGDGLDLIDQLVDVVRFGTEGGNAQALELIPLCRRHTAGPKQQQIRLQAEQALHVQLPLAADRRHITQR
ncbi:hypothetical protein D3C79_804080 [compost metagenome]